MEKAGICDRLVHTDRRTPALDIGHGHGLRFIEREEIGAGGATSNADQAQSDAASRAFAPSIVSITNARSSPTSGRRGERVHSGAPWTRCSASRSEEHTSELQSLMRIPYAVFCLKKKKKKQIQ